MALGVGSLIFEGHQNYLKETAAEDFPNEPGFPDGQVVIWMKGEQGSDLQVGQVQVFIFVLGQLNAGWNVSEVRQIVLTREEVLHGL